MRATPRRCRAGDRPDGQPVVPVPGVPIPARRCWRRPRLRRRPRPRHAVQGRPTTRRTASRAEGAAEGDFDDDDGEFALARRHRGRAQAQGAGDFRQRRRQLQAAPAARPGHRVQAQEHHALAGAGAPLQEAQGRHHRRGEVAAPQPGAHRFAGRAALRHQQAPGRLRGPADAAVREPRRLARGLPQELPGLRARPALAQPISKLSAKGWKSFVARDKDKIKDLRHEIQSLAGETGLEIGEFRKIVHMVQKGEREARQAKKRWWRRTCAS